MGEPSHKASIYAQVWPLPGELSLLLCPSGEFRAAGSFLPTLPPSDSGLAADLITMCCPEPTLPDA